MNASYIYSKALESTPEKIAIVIDDKTITYKELNTNANKVANYLVSKGIKTGDKIGFFMENNTFITYGYMGCFKIGAVVVPASYYTSEEELIYEANEGEVGVYFVSKSRLPILKKAIPYMKHLKHIIIVDGEDKDAHSWQDLQKTIVPKDINEDVDIEKPALILFTSGTTGKTKGVAHTTKSLLANAKSRVSTLRHTQDDKMITTSFLCHGAAPLIVLFPLLQAGGTAVFMSHYDKYDFADMIEKYRITHAAAAPFQWKEALDIENIEKKLKTLRYATTGGDTVDIEIRKRFRKKIGIPLVSSLGMTECGGYMTIPPHKKAVDDSVGIPIDNIEVRLVDNDYNNIKQGEIGEILVKGDAVFCCYYNDTQLTEESFIDGWFKTGDLARVDNEGYYYFEGRKKRIIVKGGGNINPLETESALLQHESVDSCIVLGVKDKEVSEEVFAFIVAKDKDNPPSEDELKNFLKGKISDRKIPAHIEIVDYLPRKDKIDLKSLRKKAQEIYDNLK